MSDTLDASRVFFPPILGNRNRAIDHVITKGSEVSSSRNEMNVSKQGSSRKNNGFLQRISSRNEEGQSSSDVIGTQHAYISDHDSHSNNNMVLGAKCSHCTARRVLPVAVCQEYQTIIDMLGFTRTHGSLHERAESTFFTLWRRQSITPQGFKTGSGWQSCRVWDPPRPPGCTRSAPSRRGRERTRSSGEN